MAKIKTRKPVDLVSVDHRLVQIGLAPGIVSRHDEAAGEWELETADPSISDADLRRVITDVPAAPPANAAADARADRRARARALLDKDSWQAKDTEAAVRLLLTEQLEG